MNEKVSRGNGTLEESTIWVDMITDSMGAVSMFSIKLISTIFLIFTCRNGFGNTLNPNREISFARQFCVRLQKIVFFFEPSVDVRSPFSPCNSQRIDANTDSLPCEIRLLSRQFMINC